MSNPSIQAPSMHGNDVALRRTLGMLGKGCDSAERFKGFEELEAFLKAPSSLRPKASQPCGLLFGGLSLETNPEKTSREFGLEPFRRFGNTRKLSTRTKQ